MTAIDIIREVAEAHGVTPDMLRSREHPYRLSEARRTAYRRLHAERGLSLVQIGQLMGGRDFATIASGISDKRRAAARRRYQQRRSHESSPRAATVVPSATVLPTDSDRGRSRTIDGGVRQVKESKWL
jgi:DNA-binding transcriptional MerR regulator